MDSLEFTWMFEEIRDNSAQFEQKVGIILNFAIGVIGSVFLRHEF